MSVKSSRAVISVKNLSFSYGATQVLKNISFEIYEKDFLGILGPNGSGKTTLLKIILGLYKNYEGDIFLLGKNIKRFNQWSKIGYVPQKATNFDQKFPATVREVVGMGLLSHKKIPRFINKSDIDLIKDALDEVGMLEFIDRRIGQLSGGQQQRVFIARALISKPKILFLDEPTTGVDAKTQEMFYDLLGMLNRDKGITIVIVSHDIGNITAYVNKLAFLHQELVFYGTHEEFCKSDIAVDFITHKKHLICPVNKGEHRCDCHDRGY